MNSQDFIKAKKEGRKLALLTAYDAPTAELLEKSGVDAILVGDSLGMVLLGYNSTSVVTMDEMIHHAKAVRRGAKKSFIIGDLPFLGIEQGPRQTLESAKRFMEEAGMDAVKLEWGRSASASTELLIKNKIPVMGHVGLTPQTVPSNGNFKVQAQKAAEASSLVLQSQKWAGMGLFSLVLECVPREVAGVITQALKIPTIGIGAGLDCDGQVLVFQDLVGTFQKFTPRFVKRYAELHKPMAQAVGKYIADVRAGRFPQNDYSFGMKKEALLEFFKRQPA